MMLKESHLNDEDNSNLTILSNAFLTCFENIVDEDNSNLTILSNTNKGSLGIARDEDNSNLTILSNEADMVTDYFVMKIIQI